MKPWESPKPHPRTRSRRPTAAWRASIIPTATPATSKPRHASRKSKTPTMCSATRTNAAQYDQFGFAGPQPGPGDGPGGTTFHWGGGGFPGAQGIDPVPGGRHSQPTLRRHGGHAHGRRCHARRRRARGGRRRPRRRRRRRPRSMFPSSPPPWAARCRWPSMATRSTCAFLRAWSRATRCACTGKAPAAPTCI